MTVPSKGEAAQAAGYQAAMADVAAYLAQRSDNAKTMAKRSPEFAEEARERLRQLEVIADDLRAGLALGAAAKRADLLAGKV